MSLSVKMGGFTPGQTVSSVDSGSLPNYVADSSGFITVTGPNDIAAFLNAGYYLEGAKAQAAVLVSADGAIPVTGPGYYVITKSSAACLLTIAAPAATTQDGMAIYITSRTAKAHVLTATGLLNTGSVKTDVATFAAFAGAGVVLIADQGLWNVRSATGITFT